MPTPAAIARARLLSDLPSETLEALVEATLPVSRLLTPEGGRHDRP